MKPVLYTMAAVNVVLIAACGYFALMPSGSSRLAESIISRPRFSPDSSTSGAARGGASDQTETGADSLSPSTAARETPGKSIPAGPVSGEAASSFSQEGTRYVSNDGSAAAVSDAAAPRAVPQTVSYNDVVQRSASYSATAVAAPAIVAAAPRNDAPPVAVPLAFTTSAEGATPSQAGVLNRLQNEFVNNVGGQNGNPNDPAYAQAWRAAQALSDSDYEQQFGVQAFVAAQLAQTHGGAQ